MRTCDRCRQSVGITTGSYFNTDIICMECVTREQAHPQYAEAVRRENRAVSRGDFNYPGIGLPDDLKGGGHA